MTEAKRKREERREEGALSPAVRGCTVSLCCPQQLSSVSTATHFATVNWFFDVSRKVLIEKSRRRRR